MGPKASAGREPLRPTRWTGWRAIKARLEKSGAQGKLGPKMNEEKDPEYWYAKAEKDGNLAPHRKLANEKPPGETVDYDELLKTWTQTAQPPKKKS